jgi:hypothetical protein
MKNNKIPEIRAQSSGINRGFNVSMSKGSHLKSRIPLMQQRYQMPPDNGSVIKFSMTTFVITIGILGVITVCYLMLANRYQKESSKKVNKTQKIEEGKEGVLDPEQKKEPVKQRDLSEEDKKQYAQAVDNLKEVAPIITKYESMRLENITERDKIEIKDISKKMDDALSLISRLSENVGYQLLENSQKHVVNRRKLNDIMRQLKIVR